jgi:hypothetical protein
MFTKNVENYLKKGLSCFPVMSTKKPAIPTWAQFQERMPSKAEIAEWKRDLGEMNIAAVYFISELNPAELR